MASLQKALFLGRFLYKLYVFTKNKKTVQKFRTVFEVFYIESTPLPF